ncbi:MAG: type II toxin-antitoxin system PemK/MazF family toxin, partial [Acidobacteria bacterium]|nr:type II toxin-antitoxin system PemK/MazF family toxin [Acidobacteriota bacterium]
GLSTQVRIGVAEGLKQDSSVHCDELVSLPKSMLTRYIGRLSASKIDELNRALIAALELEQTSESA